MVHRVRRRLLPLIASAALIVIGMFTSALGPQLDHATSWALPYDLWGTLTAASRLAHGQLGGIYAQPTGLVSLPGTAVILVPVAAVIDGLGLSLRIPGPLNQHPAAWLVAGPYQMAISCVALFAADALAEQLRLSRWRRAILAAAGAGALWGVSARWGHPEDAVATGLVLYAALALSRRRTVTAGWLAGAAVCVQPLALLALPALVAMLPWRRMPWFLARAALPSAVALAAVGLANWGLMYTAVTSQPNSPVVNHPTAWTWLAPHMSGDNVAAGPFRLATIALACGCAVLIRRRLYPEAGDGQWSGLVLAKVLWWMALGLALRSFFEPVMVAYYPWPALAVALIPAAADWTPLVLAGFLAGSVTAQGQGPWHSVWAWWVPLIAGLLALLLVSWPDWAPARERWRAWRARRLLLGKGSRQLGGRLI